MEDQYKVAIELAYIDECLALEDAFDKLAAGVPKPSAKLLKATKDIASGARKRPKSTQEAAQRYMRENPSFFAKKTAAKKDYEGPRAREVAGAGVGAGVGAAAGKHYVKKKTKYIKKNIPALEAAKAKSEQVLASKPTHGTAIMGPEYYEKHKGVVERAGKNLKKLRKGVRGGRWGAPVAGAAAVGGLTGAALMARRPKGQKLIATGKKKAVAAGSKVKGTAKKVQPYV